MVPKCPDVGRFCTVLILSSLFRASISNLARSLIFSLDFDPFFDEYLSLYAFSPTLMIDGSFLTHSDTLPGLSLDRTFSLQEKYFRLQEFFSLSNTSLLFDGTCSSFGALPFIFPYWMCRCESIRGSPCSGQNITIYKWAKLYSTFMYEWTYTRTKVPELCQLDEVSC